MRQRCANRTREGRISQTDAPKESSALCLIYWLCILYSNECVLREISGILIVAGLGSVEVSWAGENAGNMHSKNFRARLSKFLVCCFFFSRCRSIWPGQGYNSAIAAKHAFSAMTEYEPTYLHFFSVRKTDMRLDFMLECAGQESMNTAPNVF